MVVEHTKERLACPEGLDGLAQSVQLFGGFPETAALSSDMDFISFGCKLRDEWRPADGMLPAARTASLAAGAAYRKKQCSAERVFYNPRRRRDDMIARLRGFPALPEMDDSHGGRTCGRRGTAISLIVPWQPLPERLLWSSAAAAITAPNNHVRRVEKCVMDGDIYEALIPSKWNAPAAGLSIPRRGPRLGGNPDQKYRTSAPPSNEAVKNSRKYFKRRIIVFPKKYDYNAKA
jgi:hypothetical protein